MGAHQPKIYLRGVSKGLNCEKYIFLMKNGQKWAQVGKESADFERIYTPALLQKVTFLW